MSGPDQGAAVRKVQPPQVRPLLTIFGRETEQLKASSKLGVSSPKSKQSTKQLLNAVGECAGQLRNDVIVLEKNILNTKSVQAAFENVKDVANTLSSLLSGDCDYTGTKRYEEFRQELGEKIGAERGELERRIRDLEAAKKVRLHNESDRESRSRSPSTRTRCGRCAATSPRCGSRYRS